MNEENVLLKQGERPSREERKQRVLDATIRCVHKYGFHAASMSEIAAEANISVGIIYRYFENKEAIIEALIEREIEERNIRFDELNNTPNSELFNHFSSFIPEIIDQATSCGFANVGLEIMSEAARNPRVANIVKKAEKHTSDCGNAVLKRLAPNLSDEKINAYNDLFQILFDGMMVFSVVKPEFDKKFMAQIMSKILSTIIIDKTE